MLGLQLKNFRCWENKTFNFPKKGLLLLNGKSGLGKSSVLNSILFCLTGKLKNISTFGKKSTAVTMQIDNLKITRSRGPNKLTLFKDNQLYENDEAQAIINSVFGKEFSTVSYIDQMDKNSFIFLSPSEKIEFLENLLLKDFNIDLIKERINKELTICKESCISELSKMDTFKGLLSQLQPKIQQDDLIINDKNITPKNIEKIYEKTTANLTTSDKNQKICLTKIRKLEEESVSFSKNFEKRRALEDILISLKTQLPCDLNLESLNEKIINMERQTSVYLEWKEYIKYKEINDKYEDRYAENKVILDKFREEIPDSRKIIKYRKVYEIIKKIVEIEKKILNLQTQIGDESVSENISEYEEHVNRYLENKEYLKYKDVKDKYDKRKNENNILLEKLLGDLPNIELINKYKQGLEILTKIVEIEKKIDNYQVISEDDLNNLKNSISSKKEEIRLFEQSLKCYECPQCKSIVKVEGKELVLFSSRFVHDLDVKTMQESINNEEADLEQILKEKNINDSNEDEYNKLFDLYERLDIGIEQDEMILEIEKYNDIYQKIKNVENDSLLKELTKEIQTLEQHNFSCIPVVISESEFLFYVAKIATLKENRDRINKINLNIQKNQKEYDDLLKEVNLTEKSLQQEYDFISAEIEKYNDIYQKIKNLEEDSLLKQLAKELASTKKNKKVIERPVCDTEESYISFIEQIAVLKEHKNSLEKITKNIEIKEKELGELPILPPMLDYDRLIMEEKEKLKTWEEKGEKYKANLDSLNEWIKTSENNENYNNLENNINESLEVQDKLNEKLRNLIKIRDHTKNAERKSILDFIASLNNHASIYIEDFFPDEDIIVNLKTIQESKTGKEKIALNFEVNYRNTTGDLSFLSGGERDRVNLAYTLALSEIFDNRILMLDECIASLDCATSNKVIETLKEKYSGKLILCVAHQVETGVFDFIENFQ